MTLAMKSKSEAVLGKPAARRDEFGKRVKELRIQRNLRLSDVAALTGLAVSTISKVERNQMALTYDRLKQLAEGLGVDFAALLQSGGDTYHKGLIAVAETGEFRRQETAQYNYEYLFTDVWGKTMVPIAGTVKSHSPSDFTNFNSHAGEEFMLVISGEITIYFDGAPPATMKAGESIYFDSGRGHIYTSSSKEDARILVVCAPPQSQPKRSQPD
jgi:transcriptional regulator with XRE-family HTH domain